MHPIFNTIHCTSGIHCQSCRAREAGKAWRESFTRVHTKGEVPVDFDCPHGKPWIEDKPAPDGVWINPHTKVVRYQPGKPVTPTVSAKTQRFITDAQRQLAQQRKAICGACEHQKSMTDLTVSCGKCGCGGVPLYGEAKRCPEGKWQERREVVKPNLGDIAYQPARTKLPFFIHAQTPVYLQDLYRGRSAFLICGGPSFAALDHSLLRQPGILTMGVNNSVKTFRPNLWTHVDAADHFIRSIFLDPQIMKFSPMNLAGGRVWDSDKWDWTPYRVADCPNVFFYNRNAKFNAPTYLTESTINWGNSKERGGARSVMLVAVRILYELGIRRLFLLGADFNMSPEQKYHFDQDRKPGSISGNNYTYKVLQDRFATLRPIFERAGFYVYNCNPASKLTAFDHVPYEDAVRMVRDEFGNVDTANERTKDLYDTKKEPARVEQSAASESPASKPDLTIITPTGDRPEAFALCERWMSRQTFTGRVQWIVVDDGGVPTKVTLQKDGWTVEYARRERKPGDPPHTLPVQLEEALRHAQSDRVAIVEDDDWYAPGYVETVHRRLNDHDLVGESHAIYYLVNPPHYKLLSNRHHASLAATAVKGEALAFLRSFLASFRSPNVDLHLWRHFKGSKQVHARSNAAPLIVQMKGVAGRRGTLRHHGVVPGYKPDDNHAKLQSLIGSDAELYRHARICLVPDDLLSFNTGYQQWHLSVWDGLKSSGHAASMFVPGRRGPVANKIGASASPIPCDVALVSGPVGEDRVVASKTAKRVVRVVHGAFMASDAVSDKPDAFIAVSEECAEKCLRYDKPVSIVRQPINTTRFKSKRPINDKPRTIALLSNYGSKTGFDRIVAECAQMVGCAFRIISGIENTQDAINESDIVVSVGRGALEAASCERMVIVADHRPYDGLRSDGWLSIDMAKDSARFNYSGRWRSWQPTASVLAEWIRDNYDPARAGLLRKYVIENHDHALISEMLVKAATGELDHRRHQ